MRIFDSGRVQDKLINQLERKEKQEAFQRDRFFKYKLSEISSRLSQTLLMEKIIETDNAASVSDLLLKGLKKAMRESEFNFKYFIAPIRDLVPHPNLYSLYLTQYIMEVVIDDPSVIDVYGTDQDIYKSVNNVITQINRKFDRDEQEVVKQLSRNKALVAGTREYEIALDQAFRKKVGEPQT